MGRRVAAGYLVEVYRRVGAQWERCESALNAARAPVTLESRADWARVVGGSHWLVVAHDVNGVCRAAIPVDVARSRCLPLHLRLRAPRCGPGADPRATLVALTTLAELARQNFWVLRVAVGLFSTDASFRRAAGEVLSPFGFRRAAPHSYERTLIVDLAPDECAVLASFHSSARRNIKSITKQGLEIRPIADPSFAPRIVDLHRESIARTGGAVRIPCAAEWASCIGFSQLYPDLARLVGLFRPEVLGPDSLLAFACGCHHGDHVEYRFGGSTRNTGCRIPLLYGLIWDLIQWAKRTGVQWFDLGGVTLGSFGDGTDSLGGISDFKRYFSRSMVTVGEEWVLEPHPLRARLDRAISALAKRFIAR
jgi:Acetyltransferase (GNAT) domain